MSLKQLLDQALGMAQRVILRRAVNWGIGKSIDAASRLGKGAAGAKAKAPSSASPAAAKQAREAVKRARQAARITRRMR